MENENISKKRNQRRTRAERIEILEQFHRSGLTRKAFSQTYHVALSTLSKWLRNEKHASTAQPPMLFREVTVPVGSAPSPTQWAVEIVAPDGVTIRCREALPLQDVVWLLRGR